MSPDTKKRVPTEIEHLMSANRNMHSLKARSSNLGHDAFKILRDTNLMRFQQDQGEKLTNKQFMVLRDEMNGRKKAFDESVADYK